MLSSPLLLSLSPSYSPSIPISPLSHLPLHFKFFSLFFGNIVFDYARTRIKKDPLVPEGGNFERDRWRYIHGTKTHFFKQKKRSKDKSGPVSLARLRQEQQVISLFLAHLPRPLKERRDPGEMSKYESFETKAFRGGGGSPGLAGGVVRRGEKRGSRMYRASAFGTRWWKEENFGLWLFGRGLGAWSLFLFIRLLSGHLSPSPYFSTLLLEGKWEVKKTRALDVYKGKSFAFILGVGVYTPTR